MAPPTVMLVRAFMLRSRPMTTGASVMTEVLEGEGLVHGFVVVESEAHE